MCHFIFSISYPVNEMAALTPECQTWDLEMGFLTQAVCSAVCGRLSDRWIASGSTPTKVRKIIMMVGTLGAGVFLGASVLAGPTLCVVLLILVGASFGVSSSGLWAITQTQTLAGPQASG